MFNANWATLWEHVADAVPDRLAILCDDVAFRYRDLDERAARFASALEAAEVGPGTKVAFYLHNCPEYLIAYYATLKARGTPVNVNYRYRGPELAQLLEDSDATVLVVHAALAENVRDGLTESAGLRLLVEVGGGPEASLTNAQPFDELLAHHAPAPRRERSGDDQIFMYTGGTTGLPKGVVWRQRDLFACQCFPMYGVYGLPYPQSVEEVARTAVEMGEAAPRTLPVTPLVHATALFTVMDGLALGGSVVFPPMRSFDAAAVLSSVQHHRVAHLIVAGNVIAQPLADELDRAEQLGRPYDISTLRRITSSGMAWNDSNKRRLLERQPMQLLEILGSSEGGPYAYAIATDPTELPSRFYLADGATVFDDDLREIPRGSGRIGTLAFAGPMPLGYYKDRHKTAEVFRDIGGHRYVMPGDLATVAEDGAVELFGRRSGVINCGGEKIYPAEVEEALRSHPKVVDCVVFGLPDPRWQETVTAVVQVTSNDASPAELIGHVGTRLAGYKKPATLLVVDSLERSSNGKLDMRRIRQYAMEAVGLSARHSQGPTHH